MNWVAEIAKLRDEAAKKYGAARDNEGYTAPHIRGADAKKLFEEMVINTQRAFGENVLVGGGFTGGTDAVTYLRQWSFRKALEKEVAHRQSEKTPAAREAIEALELMRAVVSPINVLDYGDINARKVFYGQFWRGLRKLSVSLDGLEFDSRQHIESIWQMLGVSLKERAKEIGEVAGEAGAVLGDAVGSAVGSALKGFLLKAGIPAIIVMGVVGYWAYQKYLAK